MPDIDLDLSPQEVPKAVEAAAAGLMGAQVLEFFMTIAIIKIVQLGCTGHVKVRLPCSPTGHYSGCPGRVIDRTTF